ncbi:MAG TPA: hypothetical protein VIG73_08395 [Cerasibacillus sp.]|uniref:hypothetical protein n=1 Tax=Cerasibacillus sp. TaxID=2498711 RepID=UPI002F411A22
MQNLINTGLLSSTIALILSSIIYVINNFNTKDVERKLMSNFHKIRYVLSLSLVSAFLNTIVILVLYMIKGGVVTGNIFIGLFILSITVFSVILLMVELCFLFIARKFKFIIKLNDGTKWEIIKTTNDKGLLLKKGDEYKIIKDYYNLPIIKLMK